MSDLEFTYTLVPGMSSTPKNLTFKDKPMTSEKDEIKLKDKFIYK